MEMDVTISVLLKLDGHVQEQYRCHVMRFAETVEELELKSAMMEV